MHKSPFKFGLFLMASLMLSASIVAAIPMGSLNIFSNATAQGYNENYYEDKKYSKYPTNDYKYECQKGPFEGFFVSSVEFCDPELPVKDPIEKKDKKVPVKDAIVNIEKKLFVCENAQNPPQIPSDFEFQCGINNPAVGPVPDPDRDQYIECTPQLCRIDESDFGAQIFKDVATITALSPQGTPVNLNKLHYTVTETSIEDRLFDFNFCSSTGFDSGTFYRQVTEDLFIQYEICVDYVGDCEGTILPGEVKTCTIENYIWKGDIRESPNTAAGATTTGTTTTQSNNAITTTPTTTQSSNVGGVPQSSNIGATAALQSSSVGTPNTLPSSTPSSLH